MSDASPRWGSGKRVGLLFVGLYFTLNLVPDVLGAVPVLGEWFVAGWLVLWGALMPLLGNAALGIAEPIVVVQTGSGDMTWNYVQQFWWLVLSALAAVTWARLDRRRHDYARLYAWLRIAVRYALATAMLSYGVAKLVGNQFAPPGASQLTQTLGDSSPMGLAWTFLGFSPAYTWFAGLAEIVAGVLLLWRPTATFGALVSCGVLANVVMINFCFDVPVKLYSSLLLMMGVFVAAHDARRLLAVLVLNRPAPPADLEAPALGPRGRRARVIAKAAFLLMLAGGAILQRVRVSEYEAMKEDSPLTGVYAVEEFTRDGSAPATRDPARWKTFEVGEYGYAAIRTVGGEDAYFQFAHDPAARTVTLTDHRGEAPVEYALTAEQPEAGALVLAGTIKEGAITARLRRIETEKMLLVTRGFRWINERPFNR